LIELPAKLFDRFSNNFRALIELSAKLFDRFSNIDRDSCLIVWLIFEQVAFKQPLVEMVDQVLRRQLDLELADRVEPDSGRRQVGQNLADSRDRLLRARLLLQPPDGIFCSKKKRPLGSGFEPGLPDARFSIQNTILGKYWKAL
jgi:hypothetical protein